MHKGLLLIRLRALPSSCSESQSLQLRYLVGDPIVQALSTLFNVVEVLQKVLVHDLLPGDIFVMGGLQLREVLLDDTETLGLLVALYSDIIVGASHSPLDLYNLGVTQF